LTIIETIDSKAFKDITPEALAMVAASIANPLESKGKETACYNVDSIFDNSDTSVESLYDVQKKFIFKNLKYLGIDEENFASFEELKDYLNTIEIPDTNVSEVRDKLNEIKQKRKKMKIIQSNGGNYSVELLVKAFSRGEAIPSKVLEKYLDVIEQYKSRNNTNDINTVIEKIETEINSIDTSVKGSKSKARIMKKKEEAESRLKYAKNMKYLDERIFNEIGSNYKFMKKNSPADINEEYNKYSEIYMRLTSLNALKKSVQSCIDTGKYLNEHNIKLENSYNKEKAGQCIDTAKQKSAEIYADEKEIEDNEQDIKISEVMPEPDMDMAGNVYKWAYLNSIQPDSMASWKQMLKTAPEENLQEGTIYRAIMQTADLLSQINEISNAGYKTAETKTDKDYYYNLGETAKQARALIIKEPVEI
ncbi:MAG: hypothetical protein LUH11_00680, partial [Candidatus Gastranaerophilales bacterium]|nr:hypothetical protein [Candidatus Gastranaerophilales bacterium]